MNKLWDSLRASFWFVPILMIILAVLLAISAVAVDRTVQIEGVSVLGEIVPKGTQSAGTLLSAIATSILTVAGSIFSIAIVAIQLASGQFGPRMLRDFMQNRVNQITFGACSATFVYAITVLWAIEDSKELSFTPQISVFIGLLLTIASVFVLIYFVHDIANSVHADNLIARIGRDFEETIDRIFLEPGSDRSKDRRVIEMPHDFEKTAIAILANKTGYIHQIDLDKLSAIASEHDLVFKLLYRPGLFVVKGSTFLYARSEAASPNPKADTLGETINKAFSCGNQRKPEYDVEFPVKQLVEIAIRAISPAVNDPFTAIRCIDRLSALLCYLLCKEPQSAVVCDQTGALRLIVDPVTFESLINAAFDQIRQYGRTDVSVSMRLLESIETIGKQSHSNKDKKVLLRQATMIHRSSQNPDNVPEENDRQAVLQRYDTAYYALSF